MNTGNMLLSHYTCIYLFVFVRFLITVLFLLRALPLYLMSYSLPISLVCRPTVQCVSVITETINYYLHSDSIICMCTIDASKALIELTYTFCFLNYTDVTSVHFINDFCLILTVGKT